MSISNNVNTYDLIKQALSASDAESTAIANNISNINTAGYKREYVNFADTLSDSMDNIAMKKTNAKHLDDGNGYGTISVLQDKSTSEKSDGNNVDINAEMSNQAENTLMYEALTNQASSRLAMTKLVITGGGN